MQFCKPHLPQGKVCLCALSAGQSYIKQALERRDITVVEVEPHPHLAGPVCSHADMLLHPLEGGRALIAKRSGTLAVDLRVHGFVVLETEQRLTAAYPGDVALNCFALGNKLYGKVESIDRNLLNIYQMGGVEVVPVSQGYTKCSTCIVDKGSIITADKSIASAANGNGIEVLLISEGHIALPGYNYGFIGGCSGLLDERMLAFTGDILRHPDGAQILYFCAQRGVDIVCLQEGVLCDVGGIVPLACI